LCRPARAECLHKCELDSAAGTKKLPTRMKIEEPHYRRRSFR
jgi:hypothetical protein